MVWYPKRRNRPSNKNPTLARNLEPEHGVRRSKRAGRTTETEGAAVRGNAKRGTVGAGTRTRRGTGRKVADIQEDEEDEVMREAASPVKGRR